MDIDLKKVLNGADLPKEGLEEVHRFKKVKERPEIAVELKSVWRDKPEMKKYQEDPTEDLVFLNPGEIYLSGFNGYIIFDRNTCQTYYAPTEKCLNQNFIYREDIDILNLEKATSGEAEAWQRERGGSINPGIIPRYTCYILDNPGAETYEVYYDSNYPALTYGQSTPQGCFVHKYKNRFHRDMAILSLDEFYSNSSNKKAGSLTARELNANEAIIVSDGAWMKETSTCACVYIDDESVIKMTEGRAPSDIDQAVLISEIRGATNALRLAYAKRKKKITYYYDNTSILNCFRNRKTEYLTEIKEYKELLEKMNSEGFKVLFVEIHPKTGEDRQDDNKALMFFHNMCDTECRQMSDICKKKYKEYTTSGRTDGKTYDQVKKEFAPKKNPKYNGDNNHTRPRR